VGHPLVQYVLEWYCDGTFCGRVVVEKMPRLSRVKPRGTAALCGRVQHLRFFRPTQKKERHQSFSRHKKISMQEGGGGGGDDSVREI
jgi:hypothetical protein